jgi:hypothetical protein
MAFKLLFEEEVSNSNEELPLVRAWCKAQTKQDKDPYEKPLEIQCIKISKSGDWVIVETRVCVGLINIRSALGKNLEELIPTLKGKGKRLVLLPQKKGKLGFSIGIDDEHEAWYRWNSEEEYLWINRDKAPQTEEKPTLTAESILLPVSPSISGTKAKGKSDNKAESNGRVSEAPEAILTT